MGQIFTFRPHLTSVNFSIIKAGTEHVLCDLRCSVAGAMSAFLLRYDGHRNLLENVSGHSPFCQFAPTNHLNKLGYPDQILDLLFKELGPAIFT